ncbi:serine hydrolase family protein [Mesorhizobium sp. AR07]|uniref:serine hydrolase family protein n=1 Tax=Mesorhizobium sp. AR07 TaxID=2865838 RepID=UPI002160B013|nr:serine hydrolase family protein [Mesorhizobium sp. AR07]UVK44862.1 serine hydrolase family protein [Mesorhizobium sp. AR07]
MERLRILCLHGYHGSAQILRRQMAPLADGLDELVEFVRMDAPSLAEGDFGWWHAQSAEGTAANAGAGPGAKRYEGWQRTRAAIGSAFARQGPFDGVFGFSQGAALAALLVGLRCGDNPGDEPSGTAGKNPDRSLAFDFAIMVGGFVSADPDLARLYGERSNYDLPSVHIIGRSDTIVPPIASIDLASRFRNPLILEHEGGHIIPNAPSIRQRFRGFLEDRQQRNRSGL